MKNKTAIPIFVALICTIGALCAFTIYLYLKPLPVEAPPVQKQVLLTPHDNGYSYYEIGSVNKNDLREAVFIYLFQKFPSLYGPDCAFIISDDSKGGDIKKLLSILTSENHKMLPYSKQLFDEQHLCYRDPDTGKPAMHYYIASINEVSPLDAIIKCGCYANGKAALHYETLNAHRCAGTWQFWPSGMKIIS